jgi:mRNA interferase MazF
MSYKQGDIVRIPFPFSDDTGSKPRPAVIISNSRVNNSYDVIVAQITAKPRNDEFTFKIEDKDVDIPLLKPSQIRCHKILVAQKDRIINVISHLKLHKQKELYKKITEILQVN